MVKCVQHTIFDLLQVKTGTWIVGVVTLLGVIGVVALLKRWCSSRKERNKD